MILGEMRGRMADENSGGHAGRSTIDDLFARAAGRRPDAIAIADPPDRARFTDGAPRRLTWAQADRAVSAIANLVKSFGLPADAIVALQLPNTVESVLTLIGVLRAGLIAAPLPLLWRQAEACAALGRVGARALISCRRVGAFDHAELAMNVAAETFTIRFVCGYGRDLPDGIIPFDEVFDELPDGVVPARPPAVARSGAPADHVAVVTFDVTGDGMVPVARSHAELRAAGEAVLAEAGVAADARWLGALMTASLAGLASTVVPWLMTGGTLALHHPFDPALFAAQGCDVAVLPGPVVARLAEAGLLRGHAVIAVWRAPERLPASGAWPHAAVLVDVPVFGEIGLVAARRTVGSRPARLPASRAAGLEGAPHEAAIELTRGAAGTLAVRGAMVPRHPFPPGIERGDPLRLKIGDDGLVDTGYPCRLDRAAQALTIDGPPAGVVSVGGYRFAQRDLQGLVTPIDGGGSVAALPDVLAGHRLAGTGGDRGALRAALAEQGANPLVIAAFRDRRPDRASAA